MILSVLAAANADPQPKLKISAAPFSGSTAMSGNYGQIRIQRPRYVLVLRDGYSIGKSGPKNEPAAPWVNNGWREMRFSHRFMGLSWLDARVASNLAK
jgi:hypothetical protein